MKPRRGTAAAPRSLSIRTSRKTSVQPRRAASLSSASSSARADALAPAVLGHGEGEHVGLAAALGQQPGVADDSAAVLGDQVVPRWPRVRGQLAGQHPGDHASVAEQLVLQAPARRRRSAAASSRASLTARSRHRHPLGDPRHPRVRAGAGRRGSAGPAGGRPAGDPLRRPARPAAPAGRVARGCPAGRAEPASRVAERARARRPGSRPGPPGDAAGRADGGPGQPRPGGVVAGPVDLPAPGVGGDQELAARRPASTASAAMTSRVQTPCTGTPRALPSTRAVTSPTRSPVYGPGPVPTAIAVRSPAASRPRASTCVDAAASSSPWRRASTVVRIGQHLFPSCRATVTAGVAVSNASSSTVAQNRAPPGPSVSARGRPPGTPRWPSGSCDFVAGALALLARGRPPGTPRRPTALVAPSRGPRPCWLC